jgi:hypothetical protein
MFLFRKVFNGLTLRCCGAITLGLAVMTVIAAGLFALTADGGDAAPAKQAAYTVNFPEDAQSLQAMSDEILQHAEMAAYAKSLAEIEPAAGGGVETPGDPLAKPGDTSTPLADQLFAPETPAAPTGEKAGDDLMPTLH